MSGCFNKLKQIAFWFVAGAGAFFLIYLIVPNTEQDQIKHTTDQIHKQLAAAPSPTEASTPVQHATPNQTPTAPPQPTDTPSVATLTIDGEIVNVRAGPGTDHPVMGQVHKGDTFEANGINPQQDWVRFCCVADQNGWVWMGLAQVNGVWLLEVPQHIPTPPPTVPPPPTSTPVLSQQPPQETFYEGTCKELKAAGVVPSGGWTPGSVNYLSKRDRDKDGYACE